MNDKYTVLMEGKVYQSIITIKSITLYNLYEKFKICKKLQKYLATVNVKCQ